MDWSTVKQVWKLILGAAVIAGFFASFWPLGHLITKEAAVITNITLSNEWTWQLPIAIPRWWNMVIGALWPILFFLALCSKKVEKNDDLALCMILGMMMGTVFGLLLGPIAASLEAAIISIICAGLGGGLYTSIFAFQPTSAFYRNSPSVHGLFFGLSLSFTTALWFCLFTGPIISLAVGLSSILGSCLVATLAAALKRLTKITKLYLAT